MEFLPASNGVSLGGDWMKMPNKVSQSGTEMLSRILPLNNEMQHNRVLQDIKNNLDCIDDYNLLIKAVNEINHVCHETIAQNKKNTLTKYFKIALNSNDDTKDNEILKELTNNLLVTKYSLEHTDNYSQTTIEITFNENKSIGFNKFRLSIIINDDDGTNYILSSDKNTIKFSYDDTKIDIFNKDLELNNVSSELFKKYIICICITSDDVVFDKLFDTDSQC